MRFNEAAVVRSRKTGDYLRGINEAATLEDCVCDRFNGVKQQLQF